MVGQPPTSLLLTIINQIITININHYEQYINHGFLLNHYFPMVFPWFSYGFPMVFLWFSYGFTMVLLW